MLPALGGEQPVEDLMGAEGVPEVVGRRGLDARVAGHGLEAGDRGGEARVAAHERAQPVAGRFRELDVAQHPGDLFEARARWPAPAPGRGDRPRCRS